MLNQTEHSNDIILIIKYMLNIKKFQIRLATFLIYSTAFKGTETYRFNFIFGK